MKSARFAPGHSLSEPFSVLQGRWRHTALLAPWALLSSLALTGCPEPNTVTVNDTSDNQVATLPSTDTQPIFTDSEDLASTGTLIGAECLTEVQAAEQRPVSMYVMLDSSGSMEEPTGTGSTKWQSIQRAIRIFLAETQDSDLSIGLQYFPLLKPGTSFNCTSHRDCGDDGGPCYLSTCREGNTITLCRTAADCPGNALENPCVPFGLCSESDPNNAVACLLGSGRCGDDADGNPLGRCEDFERVCTNATECNSGPYQQPAVEIGTIAERLAEIDASLSQRPLQGLTPTAPALQGAIDYSGEYALSHPDQTVVAVLATDGLPTECGEEGNELAEITQIAAAGVASNPSVRTVVFGVFQPGDALSINNVNEIARAGDTGQAVLIDTSADVGEQFLEALRSVRSNTLACEFQLPDEEVNYQSVNLTFTPEPQASPEQLTYVATESACDPGGGNWHYDVDPSAGTPTRIEVCPNVCERFKAAQQGAISLQVGCATLIK